MTGNSATGTSPHGGGIFGGGPLTITHSIISSNTVSSGSHVPLGGGIVKAGWPLVVVESLISGNSAGSVGRGGGLYTEAHAITMTSSTIRSNHAQYGGGLAVNGTAMYLVNTTLSGNRAQRAGGGLHNEDAQTSLYNVTVTGNWANDQEGGAFAGGGVAHEGTGAVSFINSLIAANFRTDWSQAFPVQLESDCAGSLIAAGPNFVGAAQAPCAITGPAPLTAAFVLLGALRANGGPTPTHALLSGSPAIDAGEATGCTDPFGAPLLRDQRGVPQPLFGGHSRRCDLGAFEFVGPVYIPAIWR